MNTRIVPFDRAVPPDALALAGTITPALPAALAPVVILGGGPIGLVCALLLARAGLPSALVDARPVAALQRDRRLLALSRGTLDILAPLLGAGFAPMGEIHRIHVSSSGNPGAAHLGSRDFGGSAVGATVWYADLVDALARAAAAQPLVAVQRPRRAMELRQGVHAIAVGLDNGSTLHGALAVDAEGTPQAGRAADQHALLCELDLPCAAGDAIERFTPQGPLALLPLPPASGAAPRPGTGTRMSMVWCLPARRARQLAELDDADLCAQIAQALGPRLGTPAHPGPRSVFPLFTHRRDDICEHRLVHLGNAAQSLHPVAGQGFNLGIRDCVCLVDCLAEAPQALAAAPSVVASMAAPDPLLALQRYAARRRVDRTLFPALTNLLPGLFRSGLPPVVFARSAALAGLDLLPMVRRPITRLLMFGASR